MFRFASWVGAIALILGLASNGRAGEYVWIEGESPTNVNVKPLIGGWGNKQFFSGEKWLQIGIEGDKIDKELPAEGASIDYAFTTKTADVFEIWHRIGYEFARSEYQWRIDGDAWRTVKPDDLTTDLMEIQFFNEVAWYNAGEAKLAAGPHKIEFKLPKSKDGQGKFQRVLFALDAICIHAGPFLPDGPFKPDQDGRTDQDRAAEKHVFELPAPPQAGARSSIALEGAWEICRDDEQLPGEVAAPIKQLPKQSHWRGIQVPGDKNELRPDLVFAHRVWYRTKIKVAESAAGRSFYLDFPQNNLNTTVYVNGAFCGFNKNPFAQFQIDVSKAIEPGINEVWVGIKDAWYGYSTNPKDPLKLRKRFNLPKKFFHDGFQDLAYPVWNNPQSGILVTPQLVCSGSIYTSDVFCKTSVRNKTLTLDVTLQNPSAKARDVALLFEVLNGEGKVEKTFKPHLQHFGDSVRTEVSPSLVESWDDPKLWWPDAPAMYTLRTTVKEGENVLDVQETPFGFREWTTDGMNFKLNGVVWHGWADVHAHSTKEGWLDFYKKTNQKFMRFWGTSWQKMPPGPALDFFDRNGVVVRRSGMLDGEGIGYMAVEGDADLKKESDVKMQLMRNWRDQMVAQVRGERNHPSIMIWSIENEWLYINCINLYGGLMDRFEAEVYKTSDAVRAVDSTRPTMTDGGGAGKTNGMPVHGDHYTTGKFPEYPKRAYVPNTLGGGRGRWEWDRKRPRFIGEELFAAGHNPTFAYFGGEEVFIGQSSSRRAVGLCVRMLTEGYRWAEQSAFQFWQGQDVGVGQYVANAPIAVFCRQWDWSFASGEKVHRTFGIFNDSRFDDPITFTWTLKFADGRPPQTEAKEYRIAAGTSQKFDMVLTMPQAETRVEGELILSLSVKGKEVFHDVKAVSLLNEPVQQGKTPALSQLTEKQLLVFDPEGSTAKFLKQNGAAFTTLDSLGALPESGKLLIVGKDALDAQTSAGSQLAAYASTGRTVIVLEQKNPLKYQGLPAEMEAAVNEGRIAFAEDLEHPSMAGLKQKDFFTWAPDEIVYRNAYDKPTRGAKSLVQCHESLSQSALVEIPVVQGLLILSQLTVAEKLAANVVARRLLINLIHYGENYKLEYRKVAGSVQDDPQLTKALSQIGLQYTPVADPIKALELADVKIALIAATPANLKLLAENLKRVKAFTAAGGYLVLAGLTPPGLADYNKIVGYDHMIRPFRRERVTFPAVRHPLTSGITLGDVALYSSERIFPWQEGNFVASDTFRYIVDYDQVAPFAKFENDFLASMANGMGSADGWKYIINLPAPANGPLDFQLTYPKEQEIIEMEWSGNTFYWPVTKVQLLFDGQNPATFITKPTTDPQSFAVDPSGKGTKITLRLAEWEKIPGKGAVTGLDNIRLKAKRTPEFYECVKPMLNIGGLMEYPNGKGGIVLCNLWFKEKEELEVNGAKKRLVLSSILQNLKAPFAGGKAVIAGARLKYEPVDISKKATQFRTDKGWFGDAKFTFKDMPAGTTKLGGVPFRVFDFPTSPVPTVLMLGGNGIPNNPPKEILEIPVNRKADALFFLQAARIDAYRNPQEIQEKKRFETAKYVVNYADGQKAEIPIYSEIDIHDYKQRTPTAIPGAQIAWTRPYEGTEFSAVAYAKQWNNPRPGVEIKSIDMKYGSQPRGVPVLIALTAAQSE